MSGRQLIEAHRNDATTTSIASFRRRTSTACCAGTAEPEAIPAMEACGVGLLPYFPLASGLLTGKYRRDRHSGGHSPRDAAAARGVFRDKADWAAIDALDAVLPASAGARFWNWRSPGCSRVR